MYISGTTQILGVMGYPVTYSLSPQMHNAALQYLGVDYIYGAFPVPIEALESAVHGLKAIRSVAGFNLTIPHKQQILPLLDSISAIAQTVGAVNTVKRTEEGWMGTNTDVAGFMAPLQSMGLSCPDRAALILGSGGAAKAVALGCNHLGFKTIHLAGRSPDTLQKIQAELTIPIEIHSWETRAKLLPACSLVINATPIGMANHPGSPLSAEHLQQLPSGSIIYDLIYTPRPTPLLKEASSLGFTPIDGLAMLLHQGALALEFWLGVPAPIEVMESALLIPNKT